LEDLSLTDHLNKLQTLTDTIRRIANMG